MDTSVECQCDNTNSVKYIIEHKEYSLFKTRTFSDKDSEEFLLFAPPEQLANLSEGNIYPVFRYAQSNPRILREEILVPLFERGFIPTYDFAKTLMLASRNMAPQLEILLSKYDYTQDQYLELWDIGKDKENTKCQKIVSKYFNSEAKDKLREKYVSEKNFLRFIYAIFMVPGILLAMCLMAMAIAGIVYLSASINFDTGLVLTLSGTIFTTCYCPLLIFLIVAYVRVYMAKMKSYKEILEPNYVMV